VLYKHIANVQTTQAFIEAVRQPSKLSKASRSRVLRVINECKKIYA
jgi:hypothetical protein